MNPYHFYLEQLTFKSDICIEGGIMKRRNDSRVYKKCTSLYEAEGVVN